MAEKNVSGPPLPTTTSTKPVSEALLNEKVRGAALSGSSTRQEYVGSFLLSSTFQSAFETHLRDLLQAVTSSYRFHPDTND